MVLMSDMKDVFKENQEEMNKLTINSVSTIVEKILLCHKKDKEMQLYQIQSLEIKLCDYDKANEEKINYEKKLAEVQQKEQKDQLIRSLKIKEKEIENLKDSLVSFESQNQDVIKNLKEELNNCKNLVAVREQSSSDATKKFHLEKEKYLQTISILKTKNKEGTEKNKNLQLELMNLKGFNARSSDELLQNKQTVLELKQENSNLKKEMDKKYHFNEQTITELKATVDVLNSDLQGRKLQNVDDRKQINQLTERLKILPIEIEDRIQEQEKEKYLSKMAEVDRLFDNHKSVLENANVEMQDKDQLLNLAQSKIKMLQKQFDNLQSENKKFKAKNIELHTNIGKRDSRLVDCQLQSSELKEKLKVFAEKEIKNNILSEKLQKKIFLLQDHLNSIEKNKHTLQISYDTMKRQYDESQEKLNKALEIFKSKDVEMEHLKSERKAVARKLKEKNSLFVSLQQKQEITFCNIDALKESNVELQKSCEELVKKNNSLSNAFQLLEKEKQDLEKGIQDQESIKDKEIESLLDRLHGSEVDIVKLKKLLKRIQTSDSSSILF